MNRNLRHALLLLVVTVFPLIACKQGDAAKCADAQQKIRGMIKARQWNAIPQWREYAYKQCEDKAALATIDKEITDGKAAEAKEKADKARLEKEKKQLTDLFLKFAGDNKADPTKASVTEECGEGNKALKERWCTRKRQAGPYTFEVYYWEKTPEAVRFSVTAKHGRTCEELGGTVVRSWAVPGQPKIQRHHCSLGALGMDALVTEAAEAPIYVFTKKYVETDSGMKNKLEKEGK